MDSADEDQVAAWPSDAVAAATEPLSPADSASELPDLSSSWHKAAATHSLPRGRPRNHALQSDTQVCRASSGPRQPSSRASAATDATPSQHNVTQTAARAQCRARAVESAFKATGAAADALRSHALTDLGSDLDSDALPSCSRAPQTASTQSRPVLPSLQISSAASSHDGEVGRQSAVTANSAAQQWVIPTACSGDSSSQPPCDLQQSTAVQSLGLDGGGGDCPPAVAAMLGDDHLLAFGALIGEATAAAAMSARSGCGAVGDSPGCLFGASAEDTCSWKLIVQVSPPRVSLMTLH